jgi:hypothetical protein
MLAIKQRGARLRGRWGPVGPALAALAVLTLATPAAAVDPTYNKEQLEKSKLKGTAAELKKAAEEKKPWFFDALFEMHFKAINDTVADSGKGGFVPFKGESDDLRGEQTGLNDMYEVLYLKANYDLPALGPLPPLGRISLRISASLYHVMDKGDNRLLFGDMRLYFSRGFAFNVADQDFGGRVYFYWTFPTSETSVKESNISRPTLLLALSKNLPYGFTLFFRPYIRLNWHRYAERTSIASGDCREWVQEIPGSDRMATFTDCGGEANPKWLLGYELQAVYNLWLHKPVNVGLTFGQYATSKYAVSDGRDQPWNYAYYWELFAGYDLPWLKPVDMGAYLTLSHFRDRIFEGDGVARVDFTDRDHTELYLSISAKY